MSLNTSVSLGAQQQRPRAVTVRTSTKHWPAPVLKDRVSGDLRCPCILACHCLSASAGGACCHAQSSGKAACSGTRAAAHDQLLVLAIVCALRLFSLLSATNTFIVPVLMYTAAARLHFLLFASISIEHCLSCCNCSEIPYLSLWSL